MRIKIKGDGTKFCLRLPNVAIKTRLAAKVIAQNIGSSVEYRQLKAQLAAAYKILSEQRKKHGRLTLVDIQSSDGTGVTIEF